jgi:hypothetical protein
MKKFEKLSTIDVYNEVNHLNIIQARIEQNFYVTMENFRMDLEELFI